MNIPNRISLVRIFLIPLVVFFYLAESFIPYSKIISLVILIIASCTDFVDGMIARKYNMVTDLGKFLDPIADKLLTMSALILVIADKTIPSPYGVIAGVIIIGRELIISAFRQIAATKNVVMAADKWGKLKTIFQDIALPSLFLLSFFYTADISINQTFLNVYQIFCWSVLGIAVALTIISAINYLYKNWKVLK